MVLFYQQALRIKDCARADRLDDISLIMTGKTCPVADKLREPHGK
jgi:hypothetical protein